MKDEVTRRAPARPVGHGARIAVVDDDSSARKTLSAVFFAEGFKVDTYPDGHVEGRGKHRKITHTWMKVGDAWQIIGGMCGEIAAKPAPG